MFQRQALVSYQAKLKASEEFIKTKCSFALEVIGTEIREYQPYLETEVYNLYASVGWTAYTEDMASLKKGFENALLTLAAYEGDKLLGLIRTVGDGYTIVFIQDLLVLPAYQRKGIGTALIQAVLRRFQHVRQIHLVTDDTPETMAFYKSQGFRAFPALGCCGFSR